MCPKSTWNTKFNYPICYQRGCMFCGCSSWMWGPVLIQCDSSAAPVRCGLVSQTAPYLELFNGFVLNVSVAEGRGRGWRGLRRQTNAVTPPWCRVPGMWKFPCYQDDVCSPESPAQQIQSFNPIRWTSFVLKPPLLQHCWMISADKSSCFRANSDNFIN